MMKEKIENISVVILSAALSLMLALSVGWLRRGGPVMVPVLFCSVFGLMLIAAKARQMLHLGAPPDLFMKSVIEPLERQRIKEALDMCDKTGTPLARVVKAGIMKYDRPKDEIKEAMDDAFLYEGPLIEEHMDAIMTALQVVPFLGFLGTLVGCMEILRGAQGQSAAGLSTGFEILGPGLWQILICATTAFSVMVFMLLGYNFLASRVKCVVRDIEKAATELLQFFMERRISG
jgi:biopolymer transport protein ExbB